MRAIGTLVLAIALAAVSGEAQAQATTTKQALTLDGAKTVAAAAAAEARKGNEGGSIAIVDDGGNLMYLERIQPTFPMGAHIATEKARTAALFQRPSKVLEDVDHLRPHYASERGAGAAAGRRADRGGRADRRRHRRERRGERGAGPGHRGGGRRGAGRQDQREPVGGYDHAHRNRAFASAVPLGWRRPSRRTARSPTSRATKCRPPSPRARH